MKDKHTENKHLNKIIAFNLKEMKKMHKQGNTKDCVKHIIALDLMYELKKNKNNDYL